MSLYQAQTHFGDRKRKHKKQVLYSSKNGWKLIFLEICGWFLALFLANKTMLISSTSFADLARNTRGKLDPALDSYLNIFIDTLLVNNLLPNTAEYQDWFTELMPGRCMFQLQFEEIKHKWYSFKRLGLKVQVAAISN